jgi:hypothetical protein
MEKKKVQVKFVGGKVKKGEKGVSLSPSIGHQILEPSKGQ